MAYGLETYDAEGRQIMSATSRITRFIGKATLTMQPLTVSFVSVPGMTTDGTWLIVHCGVDSFNGLENAIPRQTGSYIAQGGFYVNNYAEAGQTFPGGGYDDGVRRPTIIVFRC